MIFREGNEVDDMTFTREAMALLPSLRRIALGMLRAGADAEDAVQQGLCNAWARRQDVRPETFRAWLTRIVVNECYNIQRHRMRVYPVAEAAHEDAWRPPDLALRDALDALPERLRIPFLLKYMEGYDLREIAQTLRLSVTAVKGRLHRARRALQKSLREEVEL